MVWTGGGIILIYVMTWLLSKQLFTLLSLLVIITSLFIIWFKRNIFKTNINTFFLERTKIKKLDYYHITDNNKIIDLEKRKSTFGLFQNIAMFGIIAIAFNLFSLFYLLRKIFGESNVLNLLSLILIIAITIIAYGGLFAGVVYKYTTTIYIYSFYKCIYLLWIY